MSAAWWAACGVCEDHGGPYCDDVAAAAAGGGHDGRYHGGRPTAVTWRAECVRVPAETAGHWHTVLVPRLPGVWWVDCEVCELASGPLGCEAEAVQLAGVHDDVHHRGRPTVTVHPVAGSGGVPAVDGVAA
ncbi:MAG TPA: hypothetical protein VLJ59_21435 [Mycobacteriales bacterium]|nr:hypothetical protein [Mycobacteriales bacterium]